MMKFPILILLIAGSAFAQQKGGWRQMVAERLPYMGEGNWIVVADSTFPARSALGAQMILSEDSHLNTVRRLLEMLTKDGHLRPTIYTDIELKHVPEQDAPGIEAYRQLFAGLIDKLVPQPPVRAAPHASNMMSVDNAAKQFFNVLIIKTSTTLPYTSVFIELKPGYWQDEAEQRLRQSIQ